LFHLSSAERKTLLVAGAAGGMSAVFASPLAATLLAVELLLFEWRPRSFIPVALASLVAYLVRIPLIGAGSVFPVPLHGMLGPGPVIVGVGTGIAAGFGSGILTALVYFFEDAFQKLPIHWMWWPAIGGLFVGIGGWIDPRVLGVGYDLIQGLLAGKILGIALLTLVAKALVGHRARLRNFR
jgi:chloride channel protein, CIC family